MELDNSNYRHLKEEFSKLLPDNWKKAIEKESMIFYYYYILFGNEAIKKLDALVNKCNDEDILLESYRNVGEIVENAAFKENFIKSLNLYLSSCCPSDNFQNVLAEFTAKINTNRLAFVKEIIQNAEDQKAKNFEMTIFDNGTILIHYDEEGMTWKNILALTSVGESTKNDKSKTGDEETVTIGEKGVGFKTIFASCDTVNIVSNGYSFTLLNGGYRSEPFVPNTEEKECFSKPGTTLRLNLKKTESDMAGEIFQALQKKYGANDLKSLFMHCPVMFTKHLHSINVSYCGEKKESFCISLEDENFEGNTRSFTVSLVTINETETVTESKCECFGIFKDVEIEDSEVFNSRYSNIDFPDKNPKRRIQIIAALDKDIKTGNLYSYLPADQTINAPFNIQLPVKLNNNRTRMIFNGESDLSDTNNGFVLDKDNLKTIKWNDCLLKELKDMLSDFYFFLRDKTEELWRFIPEFEQSSLRLFDRSNDDLMNLYFQKKLFGDTSFGDTSFGDTFKGIPYFKVKGTDEYCVGGEAVMVDGLLGGLSDTAEQVWFDKLKLDTSKRLIEYNKEALESGKAVGLTLFEKYADYDVPKLFNEMLEESSVSPEKRDELRKKLYEANEKSALIKTLLEKHLELKLKLYPARVNGETRYISGDGLWMISSKFSSAEDCFFHFFPFTELNECEFLRFIGNPQNPNDVLNILQDNNESLDDAKFTKLVEFIKVEFPEMKDFSGDDFELCRKILENQELGETFAKLVGKVKEGEN